jgi:hypothetical protein
VIRRASNINVTMALDRPFFPLSSFRSRVYNGNNVMARIMPHRTGTIKGRRIMAHQASRIASSASLMTRSIVLLSLERSLSWSVFILLGLDYFPKVFRLLKQTLKIHLLSNFFRRDTLRNNIMPV